MHNGAYQRMLHCAAAAAAAAAIALRKKTKKKQCFDASIGKILEILYCVSKVDFLYLRYAREEEDFG